MNKYQKLVSLTVTAAILGISPGAFADEHMQPAPQANQLAINYYSADTVWTFDDDGNHVSKTYAGLELQVTDQFKVRAAARLEEIYDAAVDDKDFDWEAAVAQIEGVISINQESGKPMVIIFGKSLETLLKPRLEAVRRSDESRNQPDELEETLGVAMEMSTDLLDSLRVSVNETEGGDMKFNSDSIRMTVQAHKALNPSIDLYGSVSYEMNDVTGDDAAAVSVGIVRDMDFILDGMEAYAQVTHYQNGFGGLSDDTTVLEIGGNYAINEKWDMTVGSEISNTDLGTEYLNHLGVAVDLGKNTSAYGAATFKGTDFNGVEIGLSKKW